MGERELGMVLLSAFLHATWSASVKGSRAPLAFGILQLVLGCAAAVAIVPFFDPAEVPVGVWSLLAATGVAHGLYFFFMCRAYEHGDLSLVYPIIRSAPAFLPFFAVPLLGERLSPTGGAGIAVVVAGIWLLHADDPRLRETLRAPATRYAFLTLAGTVAYSLLDKRAMALLSDAPWSGPAPRALVFFFLLHVAHAFVFLPLAIAGTPRGGLRAAMRGESGRALLALGVSLGSYGLILEAFRTASASYVVAVRQTSVVFAVALGVLWLRERPSRLRLLGAAATAGGVALIAAGS